MAAKYTVGYAESALDDLAAVQPKKVRQQIKDKVAALVNNPHPQGSTKVQGAHDGQWEVFRIRQGDHRVLDSVRGDSGDVEIVVLHIGHRKDVYT